jgi:hypothetical protein
MYVKADFVYDADRDVDVCPAGDGLTYRYTTEERRHPDPAILDQRVQDLPAPNRLHDRQRTADFTLGA